jgi:H+/Cl- antiporter ClcA
VIPAARQGLVDGRYDRIILQHQIDVCCIQFSCRSLISAEISPSKTKLRWREASAAPRPVMPRKIDDLNTALRTHRDSLLANQIQNGCFAPNYTLVVLGALLGALGAGYNTTIVALLDLSDRIQGAPPAAVAILVGLVMGLLAWFSPALVGSGEKLTQAILLEQLGLSALAVALFARFLIGPFSYASDTPGGLFAPLLLVGAAGGGLFAAAINFLVPAQLVSADFAVVGMAGFFTAVVRTPLTGIILVAEMTGRADLALPLLVAALGAMILTTLLGSEPIYDTLRNRMPPNRRN